MKQTVFTILTVLFALVKHSVSYAQRAHVTDLLQPKIHVIDLSTHAELATINVPGQPAIGIYNSQFNAFFYPISNGTFNGKVVRIDAQTQTIVQTFNVGHGPYQVLFSPDNTKMLVLHQNGSSLLVFETTNWTVVDELSFGSYLTRMLIDPDSDRLFVTSAFDETLYMVSLNSLAITDSVYVQGCTNDVELFDNGNKLIAALQCYSGQAAFIDVPTMSLDTVIEVGYQPHDVLVDSDGDFAYVTVQTADTVRIIDLSSRQIVESLAVGDHPDCIGDGIDERIYVSNNQDSTISVISTNTLLVTETIPLQFHPFSSIVFPSDLGFSTLEITINCFPNPVGSGEALRISSSSDMEQAQLVTLTGEHVKSYTLKTSEELLDLKGISKGTYMLIVETRQGFSRQLIQVL